MNIQISSGNPEDSSVASARHRNVNTRNYVYTPGSLWSHLKFGLVALAVIVIPPLIPGVTGRELVMGYMGAIWLLIAAAIVWGVVQSLHSHETSRRGHHARRYT